MMMRTMKDDADDDPDDDPDDEDLVLYRLYNPSSLRRAY